MAGFHIRAGWWGWSTTGIPGPPPDTVPAVATTSTGKDAGQAAVQPLTLPTGIQVGDLILIIADYFVNSGNQNTPPNFPAGWTLVSRHQTGGVGAEGNWLMVGYRVADGTEGASINITGPDATGRLVYKAYRIDKATYVGVPVSATAFGGFGPNPNPPALTPGWGAGVNTLWFAAESGSSSTVVISAYPAGYTDTSTQFSTGVTMAWCRKAAKAATEDPGMFTVTVEPRWAAVTVGVKGT